ncbi:PQQ-binding-like beta-propeller repeat protein [Granulicella sp. WH15]|uniref:outer membrane protein assembly factor BamB family protein n=1 Tax=Granulicella sp. WH15 TaxID=2602070 RepID=UPI001C704385|nr:PQQ-binding-like beta-propeller repeat protein [Granulicella sp. WH15]
MQFGEGTWKAIVKINRSVLGRMGFVACAVGVLAMAVAGSAQVKNKAVKAGQTDWAEYNGGPGGSHYSKLKQINTANVATLKQVWSFDTGQKGGLETNPLILDGVLYAYTPTQQVIAVDAVTGKLVWKFDSGVIGTRPQRGLAYWTDGKERRLIAGVTNFVYEIDMATGKVVPTFGEKGRIDLREGLGRDVATMSLSMTSPAVVYKDLLIVGDATPESLPAPPGDIRAYDVHTGKQRWIFHTIPHPGDFGYETWPKDAWKTSGAANNWCGMTLDRERGIVYVPTGSSATDWYGVDRVGNDLFANSLVALKAETGERIWHFQGVHHDLWDRDFDSPPTLVTVKRNGKEVPAVAQTSKQGWLYLFNRLDGTPLFPIEERPFPASDVPGEVTSATQPIPMKPAPFARQIVTEADLTERTPEAHEWAVEQLKGMVSKGMYYPNTVGKPTMMMPGWDGGAEWGGSAFDPATHVIYINANDVGLTESLVKHEGGSGGKSTYEAQCSVCHQENRAGSPPAFPSLLNLEEKFTAAQIMDIVEHGRGRMPPFPGLKEEQRKAVANYVLNGEAKQVAAGPDRYDTTGYKKFLDPEGYPAVAAPWGTLNALDLNTGEYLWKVPLGQYPELTAKGLKDTGSENYGGPVLTAGGVIFIASTVLDKKIRAFDKKDGKLLWEATLPYPANSTPAVYEVNGKEYVVIAAGGGREPKLPTGGVYVAFALP